MTRSQLAPDRGASQRARTPGSPLGLHRVLEPAGVLPQAAWRLDASGEIWPDEVRVRVQRLNLDAASFRQLQEASAGESGKIKAAVLEIVATRGKMQNPVTGSGGMLTGVVEEAGPDSPLGLRPGDKIASLVSLSLTPLVITDDLASWDGKSEQVPCDGHAILFGRSIAATLPDDMAAELALAVMDVCGAPALTHRVVSESPAARPTVAIIGAAGKSGSLSAAAARKGGACLIIGVVPHEAEAEILRAARAADGQHGLVDEVVVADARDPVSVSSAIVVGNGYVPGHAQLAIDLIRSEPGVRGIFQRRICEHGARQDRE